jgi:hypothetical protein
MMSSIEDDQFQKRSTEIGAGFREECQQLLESLGFEFTRKYESIEEYGVQIELIYHNNNGIALFFEVAGTSEEEPTSTRPGLERTDTVKKIIGTACLVKKCTDRPIIVLTSHLPNPELSSAKMLNSAGRDTIFDVICIRNKKDVERLKRYLDMDAKDFEELVDRNSPLFI